MSGDTLPRMVMKMGFEPMHMVRPQWISSSLPPVVTSGMMCWVRKKVLALARDQAPTPPLSLEVKDSLCCMNWLESTNPTELTFGWTFLYLNLTFGRSLETWVYLCPWLEAPGAWPGQGEDRQGCGMVLMVLASAVQQLAGVVLFNKSNQQNPA